MRLSRIAYAIIEVVDKKIENVSILQPKEAIIPTI
jgi:hypothetical protein